MTDSRNESGEMTVTTEPTVVKWLGGMDNEWCVEVDPYSGTVTVNGEEYEVSELEQGRPIHAPIEERVSSDE